MMTNVSYTGITTKIKSLSGRLLGKSDYEKIASATTVAEMANNLCEYSTYSELLSSHDSSVFHRADLEKIINNAVYNDFKKIYHFANNDQRKYLNLFFKEYELDMIKKALRKAVYPTKTTIVLPEVDEFFIKHSKLNIPLMFEANDINEFFDSLKGSNYENCISVGIHNDINNIFDYELSLMLNHYRTIWRTITRKSCGLDADILTRNYGTKIDLLNISWIYRSKFNFRLNQTDTFAVVIPCYYKLKVHEIKALVESANVDEFFSILSNTYYGRHYVLNSIEAISNACDYTIETISYKNSKACPYSIGTIYSYLIRKDYEVKRLTRILECIRYGLDQRTILQYINGGLLK